MVLRATRRNVFYGASISVCSCFNPPYTHTYSCRENHLESISCQTGLRVRRIEGEVNGRLYCVTLYYMN